MIVGTILLLIGRKTNYKYFNFPSKRCPL